MSGKGQASGSDFEADAFAYIGAHVLSTTGLPWFGNPQDVPVALSTQTGTAGDDFVVELRDGGRIEVQAKHGASGNRDFIDAAARLFGGLQNDPLLRGVMLVDSSSTGTVRSEFQEDVQRFADGIEIDAGSIMKKVLSRLSESGVQLAPVSLQRFRLVVKDYTPGSDGAALAQHLLTGVLNDPARRFEAWELLGREGLRVAKRAGRQDALALAKILKSIGLTTMLASRSREKYVDWAIETNSTIVLAPLPDVRIDSFAAWDELLPRADTDSYWPSGADAISSYHAWSERRERTRAGDAYDRRKLLERLKSAVILGGAGAGKSTLTRSLVREACEGGFLAIRVALNQVARAVEGGKSFDDALAESGFQGSGLDDLNRRGLLASADFLIADGLDETEPSRAAIATHLLAWMKGHPKAGVIVTTRPVGHSAGLLPGVRLFDLSTLTPGGTSRLASEIFHAGLPNSDRAAAALERFEDEIESNRAAALAARNPLLLSCMVALSMEGVPMPEDVPTLYGEVIDLLRRTRPTDRIRVTAEIDATVAALAVTEAGWHLAETPAMTRDSLVATVAKRLERDGFGGSFASRRAADDALLFWEEHRLFERLRIGTREHLTFVHLNLGEYAAARSVLNLPQTEFTLWVTRARRLPQWREVILLAAAMGAAERLATALLDLDEPAVRESEEAFFSASCLQEITEPHRAVVERTIGLLATPGG